MIPYTLEGELLRRRLRRDYAAYCEYVNEGFYMSHFHRYLCNEIQTFIETPSTRDMDILLLSVPPQHGKSYTVTETLPSWFIGNNPRDGVIIAGYEGSFAESFNRRNRDKYQRFAVDIWGPDAAPNPAVQGVAQWETLKGGRCRAAGLKGGITGHGCELFIIDDPIKNKEQADSETVISTIHAEMGPSVQSRIHPGGKLIVIQTRWVEGDVVGWIEDNWSEWIYKIINLPAEYDEVAAAAGPCPLGRKLGDALIGEHLGDDIEKVPQKIRVDNNWLRTRKDLIIRADGERTWNALYQGRPSAANGNLYDPSSWQYFERTKQMRESMEYMQLSVDATFKNTETSDFVAIELWGLKGADAYLWKLVNMRMGFTETMAKLHEICKEYPDIDELVIEDKANGSAIIDVLRHEDDIAPIVPVQPLGGKYARGQATSNFVAARHAHLPCDLDAAEEKEIQLDGKNASLKGIEKFVKQHTSFPYGNRDDMVDAQTQGLSRIIKLIVGDIPKPPRRAIRYTHWHKDMWEDFENLDESGQRQYIALYGAPEEWEDLDELPV